MSLISSTASRRRDILPLIILISDICEDYKVVEMMARRDAPLRRIYEIETTKSCDAVSH